MARYASRVKRSRHKRRLSSAWMERSRLPTPASAGLGARF
jgi:hypothetical protein